MSALCSIRVWIVFFSEAHRAGRVLMLCGHIKMTKWHACCLIGSFFLMIWNLFPKHAIASGCHLSASLSLCCLNREAEIIKCRKLLSRGVWAVSDWLASLGIIIVLWCIDLFQLMGSKAFGDVSERCNCHCEVSAVSRFDCLTHHQQALTNERPVLSRHASNRAASRNPIWLLCKYLPG